MALSGNNSNEDELVKDISQMFDTAAMTDDLYNTFMNNKYLKELDQEIDTICKYMPKLEEALAVQKDCVLSADHFSKNFLSFQKISASTTSEITFSERCKRMETSLLFLPVFPIKRRFIPGERKFFRSLADFFTKPLARTRNVNKTNINNWLKQIGLVD